MGKHKEKTGKTRFGMIVSKVKSSSLVKNIALGVLDFVPAGDTIKRLVEKPKEGDSNSNGDYAARIAVASVVGLLVIGNITGKVSLETLTKIIGMLGEFMN